MKGGERFLPEFPVQLILDGSDRVSLSLEIADPRDGEGHGFLSATRRRIGDLHVTSIVQMANDLARTLAGSAHSPPDI